MNIDKLNVNNQMTEVINNQNNINQVNKDEVIKEAKKENPAAIYEKGNDNDKISNTIYNKEAVLKLKQETENNKLKIIQMVQDSIKRQGSMVNIANMPSGITSLDQQAREEAEAMLGEDGELGIEKTSQRLVDFAIAISGGDTSKIEILRNAIDKGFEEARKMFNGKLPQISEDTYKATMDKLDAWANPQELEETDKAE